MEEIYLLEENNPIVFEDDKNQEWKDKIQELGLKGQESLLIDSGTKSPVPFQYMNKAMFNMFEVLCPCKEKAQDYRKSPIPLKVLGAFKMCLDAAYFGEIEIWSDEVAPDPILIGIIKRGSYEKDYYLIARWGDMLRNFNELREIAIKRCEESFKIKLEESIIDAQEKLKKVHQLAVKKMNGEWIYV